MKVYQIKQKNRESTGIVKVVQKKMSISDLKVDGDSLDVRILDSHNQIKQ